MPEIYAFPQTQEILPDHQEQPLRSRILQTKLGRTVAGSLACLGVMSGIGAANAQEAEASSVLVYEVTNTNTPTTAGVFSRNSPRVADTPRIAGHGAYDGDRVELICGVTNGDAVGPYDNNTWHYVKNLSRPNQPKFWLSDRHVLSPNRADTLAPGEKNCNEQNVSSQPAAVNQNPKAETYNTFPGYDREKVKAWALAHGNDVPPFDGACTWFASNALWAGGLQQTDEWHSWGGHGKPKVPGLPEGLNGAGTRPGSVEATAVPEFLSYLKKQYPASQWQELSFDPNHDDVPIAEPGDIIAYDWGRGEGVSHVSVVTGKDPNTQYPFVAEWGVNNANPAGYNQRPWTWSEKLPKKDWLQAKYTKIKAYILHIVPMNY